MPHPTEDRVMTAIRSALTNAGGSVRFQPAAARAFDNVDGKKL